ncbi:SDR family NAD(P)-dependent oxidoreductase [Nocardia heshunensis]
MSNDVVLVTGGANGIGAAVARRYAAAGAKVVIADLDEAAGLAVAAETGATFVVTDVSSEDDNRAAVEVALAEFGRLTLVHLNAGAGGAGGAGDDFDLERYRRVMAINVDGTLFGIRAALPALISSGGGAIVVTSSLAGVAPTPFDPAYSASKHAIIGFVRSLAMVWSEAGVTMNAICPGVVETGMIPTEWLPRLRDQGYFVAHPDEVAAAVEHVVRSGETGQAWEVQGGKPVAPIAFPAIELSRAGTGPVAPIFTR